MKKIIYYILNYIFFYSLELKIMNILEDEKKLVIFDVGCFRGTFSRKILHLIKKRKFKFYLFDVNKNTKRYISDLLLSKHFRFNQVALSNKNGTAEFNYNSFFESSGSSLSPLYRDETKWVLSRKLILKILLQSTKNFIKYKVSTSTLDTFVKKNNIKSIDILKIDVEGSELNVLNGGNLILKKTKCILVEITDTKNNFLKKYNLIMNLLKKNNFKLLLKKNIISYGILSNQKAIDALFINEKF